MYALLLAQTRNGPQPQLTNLTRLSLNANVIHVVPPQIGQLTRLTALFLEEMGLKTVPPQLGNLVRLKQLFLNTNDLLALPPLTRLTRLEALWLVRALVMCTRQLMRLP